ncbi:MAG: hypothetical protein JOZ49_04930 [Mycolicibacterium sp.]|nr:hypothetical protein [Mycolicibacterium sp.]
MVLFTALRDMQWRRLRFAIAVAGTGLVFAMTLVLTGLTNGSGRRMSAPSIPSASICS